MVDASLRCSLVRLEPQTPKSVPASESAKKTPATRLQSTLSAERIRRQ